MFGYASFAQPTFAGLGSALYAVNILEEFNVADINDSLRTAFGDILEAITYSDTSDSNFAATAEIIEALIAAESSIANASFVSVITEGATLNDINSKIKTQYASQVEPIVMFETELGLAWVRINDNQSTSWVLIDNRQ